MEQCIIDNKICPASNLKCKECKLVNCENAQEMLEKIKKQEENKKTKLLRKLLPQKCAGCSFLQIININKGQVYCPYMLERCVIK
jgi:hypothetical protein